MKRGDERGQECLARPKAGRAPHPVKIDALSPTEWSYLHGLCFTDGNVCRGYHIRFGFQGNEEEIARRVAGMLWKLGLKPVVYRELKKNQITVQSYSTRLASFLPRKETLANNMALAHKFMRKNNLLLNLGFCAGLIDGDGTCRAYLDTSRTQREGSFGTIKVLWTFSQTKYPFLRKVFQEFVEFLAPNSTTEIYARGRVEGVQVNLRGRDALLQAGLARWSWKAGEFIETLSRLAVERERKKAEWTKRIKVSGTKIKDVSRILGIPYKTLITWKQRGKLRTALLYEGGGTGRLVVPRDEAGRLLRLVLTRAPAEKLLITLRMRLMPIMRLLKVPLTRIGWFRRRPI